MVHFPFSFFSHFADPFPELSKMAESYTRLILDQISPPPIPQSPSPAKKKKPGQKVPILTFFLIFPGLASFRGNITPIKLTQSMSVSTSAPTSPVIKKTASLADISKLDDDDVTVTSMLQEDTSSFYDWSAEYFSRPIMKGIISSNALPFTFIVTDFGAQNRRFKQQRIDSVVGEAKRIHSGNYPKIFISHFFKPIIIQPLRIDSTNK
jgi:hypothetical protein